MFSCIKYLLKETPLALICTYVSKYFYTYVGIKEISDINTYERGITPS